MNTTRVLRTVSIVLLSVSAAATCGFVWLKTQGGAVMSVQSGSMEPALSKGDLLVVTRSPDYKVGDVITFMSPDKKSSVTHRLTSVSESSMGTTFVTKGDANMAADVPISKGSVLGRVSLTIPLLGYVSDILRTPLGLAILIYLPATVF